MPGDKADEFKGFDLAPVGGASSTDDDGAATRGAGKDAGAATKAGEGEVFYADAESAFEKGATVSLGPSIYTAAILYPLLSSGKVEKTAKSTHPALSDRNTRGAVGVGGLVCADPTGDGDRCGACVLAYTITSFPWFSSWGSTF